MIFPILYNIEIFSSLYYFLDSKAVSAVLRHCDGEACPIACNGSFIFFDCILPYLAQVVVNHFSFLDEVLFDLRILVVTAFLVENLMRFAFCQQSTVDWVASTPPNCCFHLVKVPIGRNFVYVTCVPACLSDFGYISAEIAAFFPSSELLWYSSLFGSRFCCRAARNLSFFEIFQMFTVINNDCPIGQKTE